MMKTSVIEVHDMLSVFSVEEVEKRIGELPGVDSVTVNYAVGSATVRFDETRLEVSDIKSGVRQRGYAAAAASGEGHDGHTAAGVPPVAPGPTPPSTAPVAPARAGAASADTSQQDKAAPSTTSDSSQVAPAISSAAPATDGQPDNTAPDKR